MQTRQPILFLSHGSPVTALGGDELTRVWSELARTLRQPAAILAVSGHWTTRLPIMTGSAQPETMHDFGGFADELYALRYPAPGAPDLAQRIKQQLAAAGIVAGIDASRGLDHGAWVPLRTLFPAADVPVVQLSVQPEHCARHHYALGAALASLTATAGENVLIVATGHMTHNLGDFMRLARGGSIGPSPDSLAFRNWAHARLIDSASTAASDALLDWLQAPGAQHAHPTPEHFLPLFVALGAAGEKHTTQWLGGGWVANALAADNYRFAVA